VKVLFSHDIFVMQRHGGASRVFAGLHGALRARGVDSRVFAGLHVNTYLAGQRGVAGVRVPGRSSPGMLGAYGKANLPVERAMVARWRPSVYHLTYFPRRTDRPPAPVAVTVLDMIHERYPDQFPPEDRTSDRKRHWVGAADLVFTISRRTKDDLVSMFSVPEHKVVVVHPGVGRLAGAGTLDRRRFGDYLLYVGERGIGYKNFDGLVHAMAASQVARSCRLVCFGGRPMTAEERGLLERHGMAERTFLVNGGDAELADLYAGARALVYPSKYEGFGFPPVEAMAAGCPVACARAGSLPEVVGDAALLFDPEDVDDIAGALDRVVADDGLRSRLVDAGTARAAQFTWERAGQEAVDGYRRLADLVAAPTDPAGP
jgi:glycosyltransferase involved in cell wall biosynthesis